MGKTSNESKWHWNEAHYTQVKASVDPKLAESFKSACRANGVSYASVLSDLMGKYAGIPRVRSADTGGDTRRKRRKEVCAMISRLECILAAETASMENTLENLQGSERYEETERIVTALCETADMLREVYV
jgi:hypothetical protein